MEQCETCARCGVIFAKVHDSAAPRPVSSPGPSVPAGLPVKAARSEGTEWRLLTIGLTAAIVAHALPFVSFLLSPLVTLLHEFGHAVAAWLLVFSLIPLVIAFLLYLYRERVNAFARSLLLLDPD